MEERIKKFLSIPIIQNDGFGDGSGFGYGSGSGSGYGFGSGDGFGSGSGSGSGYGFGYGFGSGDGDGDGFGSGSGYGFGSGFGLNKYNGCNVYLIDRIQTILYFINFSCKIAQGYIINSDLTLTSCYIIKESNYFSHGKSLKDAYLSLQEKLNQNLTISERIEKFKNNFKEFNLKVKASELFTWHNILTGSCKFGRESFCKDHSIDISKDSFTIYEFIELTKNSYGGEIIKQLIN